MYVGITKQIMPWPEGVMAEWPTRGVIVHPRQSQEWTITSMVGHSAMSPSGQGIICILIRRIYKYVTYKWICIAMEPFYSLGMGSISRLQKMLGSQNWFTSQAIT